MLPLADTRPSTITSTALPPTPLSFVTATAYTLLPYRYSMLYSRHDAGALGSMKSVSPRFLRPRIPSRPTRYIQLADPVYQVQPPRPTCPSALYTSAATTYGSTL